MYTTLTIRLQSNLNGAHSDTGQLGFEVNEPFAAANTAGDELHRGQHEVKEVAIPAHGSFFFGPHSHEITIPEHAKYKPSW